MTGSLDAGNEIVSVALVEFVGVESITTLPFVICSFIFFSNAMLAMLEVTVTAGAGVLFAPLADHSHKNLQKEKYEYGSVLLHAE